MSYSPTTWTDGDLITAVDMNKIEQGIAGVESAANSEISDLKSAVSQTSLIDGSATWSKGVLSADGTLNTSINGVCSDYLTRLDIAVGITDAKASIHFYDHRCLYIGKINSQGTIDKVSGDWKWFMVQLTFPL